MSSGTASLATAALSVASHSITAVYGGDANDLTSTSSPVSQVVNKLSTSTTLTSSLNPSTSGQSVTFKATVSPAASTGTVTFNDGGTSIGTGTLSAGTASFATSTLSAASHSITAVYGGDGNHLTSSSSGVTQVVNKAATTTKVTSSLNPSTFGKSVTFQATVTPATATGTVAFKDGATSIGTAAIASGTASFATSTLSVASHSITAVYGGDGSNLTSTSTAVTQVVNKAATTTVVASSLNPSIYGQSVTFKATVSPATASGTVTFKSGTTTIGTGTLTAGAATLAITTLAVGSHSITAVYGGDANDLTSTSAALTDVVNKAATTTALTSSVNPSASGQSVTFTATVSPATASGTVTFKNGTTTIGIGTVTSGAAKLAVTTLSVASHSITAVYGGDGNDSASTSPAVTQVVN